MKHYIEKKDRDCSSSPATPSKRRKSIKLDTARAAFKVAGSHKPVLMHLIYLILQQIDKYHNGFVDREEFLQFTR